MRDVLPPEKLSGAVALMSATLGIGGMFGMPMAGVISAHWGLPALFWVTGGFGVVLIVVLPLVVPESAVKSRGRFDFLGATVLTLAMTALLLAVSKGTEWGWASPEVLVLIASGVVLLCGWIPWELHTPAPLVDLRTSLRAPILVSNVCAVLLGFAMFISALAATQELQLPLASADGLGLSAAEAGLAMMPGGVLMIGLAPVSSESDEAMGSEGYVGVGCDRHCNRICLACAVGADVGQYRDRRCRGIGRCGIFAGGHADSDHRICADPSDCLGQRIQQPAPFGRYLHRKRRCGSGIGQFNGGDRCERCADPAFVRGFVLDRSGRISTGRRGDVGREGGADGGGIAARATNCSRNRWRNEDRVSRRTDPIFVVTAIFDWNQPGTRDSGCTGWPLPQRANSPGTPR